MTLDPSLSLSGLFLCDRISFVALLCIHSSFPLFFFLSRLLYRTEQPRLNRVRIARAAGTCVGRSVLRRFCLQNGIKRFLLRGRESRVHYVRGGDGSEFSCKGRWWAAGSSALRKVMISPAPRVAPEFSARLNCSIDWPFM